MKFNVVVLRKYQEWRKYEMVVCEFLRYLENTENMKFRLSAEYYGENGIEDYTVEIPYMHRWKTEYKNGVLWKVYQLEEYLKMNPYEVITMVTFTTSHGYNKFHRKSEYSDVTIQQSFADLKKGWAKIRHHLKKYQYVWIMEPHKNGYPHIHVVVLSVIPVKEQRQIKELWVKWGIGSHEHGVNFEAKEKDQSVKSVRNYLIKYMRKTIYKTESKFGENEKWTTGELIFNALAYKHQWRFWGATKALSAVMRFTKKADDKNYLFVATEMRNANGEYNELWAKKGHIAHLALNPAITVDDEGNECIHTSTR